MVGSIPVARLLSATLGRTGPNRLGFSLSFSNFDLEATSSSHQSRTISKEVFKSTFKTLKLSEKAT